MWFLLDHLEDNREFQKHSEKLRQARVEKTGHDEATSTGKMLAGETPSSTCFTQISHFGV